MGAHVIILGLVADRWYLPKRHRYGTVQVLMYRHAALIECISGHLIRFIYIKLRSNKRTE